MIERKFKRTAFLLRRIGVGFERSPGSIGFKVCVDSLLDLNDCFVILAPVEEL